MPRVSVAERWERERGETHFAHGPRLFLESILDTSPKHLLHILEPLSRSLFQLFPCFISHSLLACLGRVVCVGVHLRLLRLLRQLFESLNARWRGRGRERDGEDYVAHPCEARGARSGEVVDGHAPQARVVEERFGVLQHGGVAHRGAAAARRVVREQQRRLVEQIRQVRREPRVPR